MFAVCWLRVWRVLVRIQAGVRFVSVRCHCSPTGISSGTCVRVPLCARPPGTEKYPDGGEYSRYISNHGGYDNAYTSEAQTNYYFKVDAGFLRPTLDRFAQFFITPLLSASAAAKEMTIVDSEFRKDVPNDGA